jgi:hypothetical protein
VLNTLTNSVFPLFYLSIAIAFFFPFLQEKIYKQLAFGSAIKVLKKALIVAAPYIVLFIAAQALSLQAASYWPYLLGGIALPAILSAINLPKKLQGVVILLAAAIMAQHLSQATNILSLVAGACGIVSWKIIDCLDEDTVHLYDDVLPALFFLSGIYYIGASAVPNAAFEQGLLLGTLSVVLLLRLVEGPFLSKDPVYIKRLMLSATGGLGVLIVTSKLLLAPQLGAFGLLTGVAFLVTYLLQEREERLNEPKPNTGLNALMALVLIGLTTLVAYRLFGGFGLILAGTTTIVGNGKWLSQAMGFFFIARVLLQGYVAEYVANVTGINTTHPYVGLSLYGGMLLLLTIALALRDVGNRRILIALLLFTGTLVPCLSNYFLHAEAGGGFLQVCVMAGILLVVVAPLLYQKFLADHELMIMLPAQMLAVSIVFNELIPLGESASAVSRITALIYLAVSLLVTSTLCYKFLCKSTTKPVNVSRD